MLSERISELDAKKAIDELRSSGKFNSAMERYLSRNYPNLLGSLGPTDPSFMADIQDIASEPDNVKKRKKHFGVGRYVKSIAAVGSLILSALGGYILAKDINATHHHKPLLDLDDIISYNSSSDLADSGVYLAETPYEFGWRGNEIINAKNRFPGDAKIYLNQSSSIYNNESVSNSSAWGLSVDARDGVALDVTSSNVWAPDQQLLQFWIDNSTGEFVSFDEQGNEIYRLPLGNQSLSFYSTWLHGEDINPLDIYLDYTPDGSNGSGNISLDLQHYYVGDSHLLKMGQEQNINAGIINDEKILLKEVNESSNQYKIEFNGTDIILDDWEAYSLTDDNLITLRGEIEDNNSVYVYVSLGQFLDIDLPFKNYQFVQNHTVNFDGQILPDGITTHTSTLANLTKTSPTSSLFVLPKGDKDRPRMWVDKVLGDDMLSIHLEARDNHNLSKVEILLKDADGIEAFVKEYNLSGTYFEDKFNIPLNKIPLGNFTLEQKVLDWKENFYVVKSNQHLGVKSPDYSNVHAEVFNDYILLYGLLNNSFGGHKYNVSLDGRVLHNGELDVSAHSVSGLINLTNYKKGVYSINFERPLLKGDINLTVLSDEIDLIKGEDYNLGNYILSLDEVTSENVTLSIRNKLTGENESVTVNETNVDSDSEEIISAISDAKSVLDLKIMCEYIYSNNLGAAITLARTQKLSMGKTMEDFEHNNYTLIDILNGQAVITRNNQFNPENYLINENNILDSWLLSGAGFYLDINKSSVHKEFQNLTFILDRDITTTGEAYNQGFDDGFEQGFDEGDKLGHDSGHIYDPNHTDRKLVNQLLTAELRQLCLVLGIPPLIAWTYIMGRYSKKDHNNNSEDDRDLDIDM